MNILANLRALLGDQPLFTLEVAGAPLRVVRFFGREGLSSLFDFRLELAGPELELGSLVDKPALLQIGGLVSPRHVHGVLSEIEYVGETRGHQLYEADLVPWIWRLQHRHDCRIFQDRTTPQILEEVLVGAGLAKDWIRFDLIAEYGPRNYCVQYRESDLSFISRLMEDDGIFYFFEHAADKHVLVIADHPGAHKPISGAPRLWFKAPGGDMVADREHVQQFRFGERIRPGKVSLRDFNLHKPEQPMEAKESAKLHGELEVYAYPGRYQDPSLGKPHQGQSIAKARLEALQASRRSGTGTSDCPRICAGHSFDLIGHARYDLDGSYRLVQVTHSGHQPQVLDQDASGDFSYHNEFTVTEMSQPFRAAAQTPRPKMGGLQTATVVGPEGEEVHPDAHGRVKVQFHWDRAEPFNDTSSCWVRVSQQWAGNGWGTMFIPRIGHEVLVDFIEGDPDRPVIVGRIYTGNNRPPYPLPDQKTKSTIKSESSIGGGGFNELRFEDLKGQEEVFLHAQKDWNTVILNNLTETVGVDRTATIGSNETITVGAARTTTIGSNETLTIGAARTVSVGSNDATTVGAVHSITIAQATTPPPAIPPTGVTMRDTFHELTTGLATITVNGGDVMIKAVGNIVLDAGGSIVVSAGCGVDISGGPVDVTSNAGDLSLRGGPMVKINCPPAPPPPPQKKEAIEAGTESPLDPKELFAQLDFDPEGDWEIVNAMLNPIDAYKVNDIANDASAATLQQYPEHPGHNDEADAFRHALWNYNMTVEMGAEEAKKFADAHERNTENTMGETMMDLFNNKIGRDLAMEPNNKGLDPVEVVRGAILDGRLRTSPFIVKP